MRSLFLLLALCIAASLKAQCPLERNELTPTIRALLQLERPAALSVQQWEKVIENPDNLQDLRVKIYEEDRFGPCALPPADWYILLPGRRPPEKEVHVVPSLKD